MLIDMFNCFYATVPFCAKGHLPVLNREITVCANLPRAEEELSLLKRNRRFKITSSEYLLPQ